MIPSICWWNLSGSAYSRLLSIRTCWDPRLTPVRVCVCVGGGEVFVCKKRKSGSAHEKKVNTKHKMRFDVFFYPPRFVFFLTSGSLIALASPRWNQLTNPSIEYRADFDGHMVRWIKRISRKRWLQNKKGRSCFWNVSHDAKKWRLNQRKVIH